MHSGRNKGEMIRCCLCANWFYEDCVGIKSEDDRGGAGEWGGGGGGGGVYGRAPNADRLERG